MEVTFLGKLLISFIVTLVIAALAALIDPRGNDAKVGLGCSLMIPTLLIALLVVHLTLPKVVVISGDLTHERAQMIWRIKSPDGSSTGLSLGKRYLANFSNDTLVLYPEYYMPDYMPEGKAKAIRSEQSMRSPIEIPPNSVVEIEKSPDFYFQPSPYHIETKPNEVKVIWTLETARSIQEQESLRRELMQNAAP